MSPTLGAHDGHVFLVCSNSYLRADARGVSSIAVVHSGPRPLGEQPGRAGGLAPFLCWLVSRLLSHWLGTGWI